jgi:hypothetical protein
MKIKISLISVLSLLFAGICYANPIVVGPPDLGVFSFNTKLGLMINLVADFTAICIGYLIIKRIRTLVCWRFLVYLGMVFLGGVIIDVLTFVPCAVFFFFDPQAKVGMIMLFFLAGMFLYLFNSWLSEKIFDLELSEKVIIGLVMALLTNPVIGFLFANQNS